MSNSPNQITDDEKEEETAKSVGEPSEEWNTLDESIFTKALAHQLKIVDKTTDAAIKTLVGETKPKEVKPASSSTPSKLNSNPATQSNKSQNRYKLSNQSRKFKFDAVKQNPSNSLGTAKTQVLEQKDKMCFQTNKGNLKPPSFVPPILDLSSLPHSDTEDKALASMLMAWYMAGYHTGQYDSMKRRQAN